MGKFLLYRNYRPTLNRRNIYTVIFKFNLIKSRMRARLGLELRASAKVFCCCIYYGISSSSSSYYYYYYY